LEGSWKIHQSRSRVTAAWTRVMRIFFRFIC